MNFETTNKDEIKVDKQNYKKKKKILESTLKKNIIINYLYLSNTIDKDTFHIGC